MGIRAGLLNENIEIYKPVTTTNQFGEETTTFEFYKATKAREINDSGNRTNFNSEIFYAYTKTFQVRYYIDINEYDRIKWNNKFYRILDINPNKEQQYIGIKTELIND